jgi:heptosyltransferase-2
VRARGPLVAMSPGAAYGHAKQWPPDRFAELVSLVWRELGASCVLLGSAGDVAAGREIEFSRRRRAAGAGEPEPLNLIGQTDLSLLMGIMSLCAAIVSNDSGAMHLGSAVGIPVAAIFGPTREWATHPLGDHEVISHPVWCRPCMLRECPIDHRCMTRISESRVLDVLRRQLATSEVRR